VLECRVLRVFTHNDEGGNHLGVVTAAGGLDAEAMQNVAARLGFSETIFMEQRESAVVRIFTPVAEIPFAGHPLVGAAWMMAQLGVSSRGRILCGLGEIEYRAGGDEAEVSVPLVVAVEDAPVEEAGMAGVHATQAWWVDLPLRYLVAEVSSRETVAGAEPDLERLSTAAWSGTYVFARAGELVKARFFAPALGVPEDPATGSAAVALAAVMVAVGNRKGRVFIEQGDEMGAPCRIGLAWTQDVAKLSGTVRDHGIRRMEL
jgi:trans-2,3-dihydro-3-hydroxyanthranilate isomerase